MLFLGPCSVLEEKTQEGVWNLRVKEWQSTNCCVNQSWLLSGNLGVCLPLPLLADHLYVPQAMASWPVCSFKLVHLQLF